MAITKDDLGLPLAIADTARELAILCDTNENNITSIVCKNRKGIIKNPGFIQVELEEEE
jgi:hypothetical protein